MTPRQTVAATLAALILVGATASAAEAATRHHGRRAHIARMHGTNHASTARGGRTAQDNMADQLNAQSLQQSRGAPMQGNMPAAGQGMGTSGGMAQ